MPHGLHPRAHSSGCSCHPLELNQPAVLVAVEALVVRLRPGRVLVLLGILVGLLLPSRGRLAGLDRLVLLLGVTLLGHRYNCGVNDLSAARNVSLCLEILAEAFEQLV